MADEKKDKTKKSSDDKPITFIDGRTNILLIAPHSSKEDDKNIGKLIRDIATDSQCYAIINDKYVIPKNGEVVDKAAFKVNLNSISQAKEHLKDEFFDQIINYKDSIVKGYGDVIILWMHSVDDKNISKEIIDPAVNVEPDDVKVLVGWGQKTGDDRHTSQKETVDKLIAGLNKHSLQAVFPNPDIKKEIDYCGWDSDNMIQLFRDGEYKDDKVTSIQFAFRNSTLKSSKNLYSTSKSFTEVIKPDVKGSYLIVKNDTHKVEKAYNDLKKIFVKQFQIGMLKAGEYLIDEFFGGSYKRAEKKNFKQNASLRQLFLKFQKETDGNAPQKTWLYNAIDVAIAEKKYSEVSSYGQLAISHKKKLIHSKLPEEQKKKLIDETVKNKYTVDKLQKKIDEQRIKQQKV